MVVNMETLALHTCLTIVNPIAGCQLAYLWLQILLSMLVNKLGDPDYKTASKAVHQLNRLGALFLLE